MLFMATSTQLGGALDRRANPRVSTAAADVAGQRLIDVAVGRLRNFRQQRRRRHDLPGLAVTALDHVKLRPGLLHRVRAVRRQALDGENLLSMGDGGGRCDAGA